MAYHLKTQRTVLFGGRSQVGMLDDTWEWDGTNWIQSSPATRPQAREYHSMAYHLLRERVVLTGGPAPGTWEWDGTDWVVATSGGSGGAMAYDLARDRVVTCCTGLNGNLSPVSTQPFGAPCAGSNGLPLI